MPVSLDELLQELPPERRADLKRRASDLAADYRLTADQSDLMRATVGIKAVTGQRCPESGVWKVETTSATLPIAIGNPMPPYADRAATWVLIERA